VNVKVNLLITRLLLLVLTVLALAFGYLLGARVLLLIEAHQKAQNEAQFFNNVSNRNRLLSGKIDALDSLRHVLIQKEQPDIARLSAFLNEAAANQPVTITNQAYISVPKTGFQITVKGTYHKLVTFIQAIEQGPLCLDLEQVSISSEQENLVLRLSGGTCK
jgi:Tfp pilus assembly protein PilO